MKSLQLLLFLSFFLTKNVFASEKGVLDNIFQNYDPRVRPIKNSSSPLVISIHLIIIRLIEVNAQQEYIQLALSTEQMWKDEFLNWDPSEYNGTFKVNVATTALWMPDTMITTTSFEDEELRDKDRAMATVQNDGTVYVSRPFVLSNYCPMQTNEFPYDQQNCIIIISSWLYPSSEILFVPMENSTTAVQYLNSEWEIEPYMGNIFNLYMGAVDDATSTFRQVKFTLTIKRKSTYYVWVIIIPTFIITALSIAGIFAPVNNIGDRQEKITLGLTTLLTLAVILSMVTDEMPRTTSLPLLGLFVLVEILIIVISMAVSLIILFLHQRATTRAYSVPRLLAKILCDDIERTKTKINNVVRIPRRPPTKVLYGREKNKQEEDEKSLDILMKFMKEMVAKQHAFFEKQEQEIVAQEEQEYRKNQWLFLFDHIDLLLFAAFQSPGSWNTHTEILAGGVCTFIHCALDEFFDQPTGKLLSTSLLFPSICSLTK